MDLQRTIDYLETRDDIDTGKLAYFGLSWGARWGPVFTAVETRFSASVLLAGGMRRYGPEFPPEAVPQNFAPRSTVPVLMINGRNDFGSPLEYELLVGPGQQASRTISASRRDRRTVIVRY